jgi:hypothetical protein
MPKKRGAPASACEAEANPAIDSTSRKAKPALDTRLARPALRSPYPLPEPLEPRLTRSSPTGRRFERCWKGRRDWTLGGLSCRMAIEGQRGPSFSPPDSCGSRAARSVDPTPGGGVGSRGELNAETDFQRRRAFEGGTVWYSATREGEADARGSRTGRPHRSRDSRSHSGATVLGSPPKGRRAEVRARCPRPSLRPHR